MRGTLAKRGECFQRKIERLKTGAKPRVLDLFSGCGGISLGFHAAGCQIDAAVEIDELAAATHARNFHAHLGSEQQALHARARDITRIEPDELVEELGLGPVKDAFDILVGGPPCQAYARVGRAKLREIAEHPRAFKVDPRGNLYLRYLHYVKATQPLALLVENVPDVLNYGGHNVMSEIAEALSDLGYTARYSLINTAFHGVPQMRDRVFLIAYRKELRASVVFPKAINHMVLPSGYDGTRSVALKHIDMFSGHKFEPADHGDNSLPGPVTCEQALGDLPPITLHLEGKLRRGARRFDELISYSSKSKLSPYARLMRNWPGFEVNRRPLGPRYSLSAARCGDVPGDAARGRVSRCPFDSNGDLGAPCSGGGKAARATAFSVRKRQPAQADRSALSCGIFPKPLVEAPPRLAVAHAYGSHR